MNAGRRTLLFLLIIGVLAGGLSITFYLNRHRTEGEMVLHVGAGDDISGLLMQDLIDATPYAELPIELNTFMDCCGNAAQWAMTSDELDMGFYCGSIALTLINRNSDLEIYGPAIMNAEMVARMDDTQEIHIMAIPLKRSFLEEIVYDNFPSVTDTPQVSTTALLYALSGDKADGAVVDIAKALQAPDFAYRPLSDEDHISYYLVVNSKIIDTPYFDSFLTAYNQIADNYNDVEYLKKRYAMNDSFWQQVRVQILHLD